MPLGEARILDGRAVFKDGLKPFKHDLGGGGWIWAQAPASTFVSEDRDELFDSQVEALAAQM